MGYGLLIASVVATVVGAGVTAYGQAQAGKTQSAIAQYNADAQERNARMQTLSLQVQAALKEQEARNNFLLREAEAKARFQNAKAIEQRALGQDDVNRANITKRRQDFARMQGTQRAAIAASGVVESSGTPLDLLAETASRIQQDAEEQSFTNEQQRRTLFAEAGQERLGGKLALAGATLDRDSGLATAALQDATARGALVAGLREAEITRLTGAAAAQAGKYAAAGTLLSGASSAFGTFARS